jgi:subtilisin family serine protease
MDNGEIDEADKTVPDAGSAGEPLLGTSPCGWHCPSRLGNQSGASLVKVILQLDGKPSGQLNALLASNGVKIRKHFTSLDSFALELPLNVVNVLSQFSEVAFISIDSEVMTLGGHVAHTSGADNVRTMSADGALDGNGIGIAIVDSGIYNAHTSFTDTLTGQSRVVVNQDFTGEGRTDDPYGHGTHVAAAAAGNGIVSRGEYIGIAPRARLLNLRVLNGKGIGSVSNVLGAINWLMQYGANHNVRVVNLSLGMPAVNSYKFDPLCVAVRKLVDRGMVVIAAAGNNGKNSAGQKVYGQVHAPGIEPSVITVGAVDTHGTDTRGDDTVATYSSRGPSRSFWTDENGVNHYDNIIKPELSAPGNKLVFAQSPNNFLVAQNPSLDASVSNSPTRKQMMLSGTSMAAPLVAGTAALMFEANPTLTPNLVKSLMMYTAQQLPNFNTF